MRGIQVKVVHTCERGDRSRAADGANAAVLRTGTHPCSGGARRYTHLPLRLKYTYVSKGFLVYE